MYTVNSKFLAANNSYNNDSNKTLWNLSAIFLIALYVYSLCIQARRKLLKILAVITKHSADLSKNAIIFIPLKYLGLQYIKT